MGKHATRRKSKVNNPLLRHSRESALGPNGRMVLKGCKVDYDAITEGGEGVEFKIRERKVRK